MCNSEPAAEINLAQVTDLLACDHAALVQASLDEGFNFLARMLDEWIGGKNRFDRPGERIVGAFIAGRLVGLCGLSDDPYTEAPEVGRIRHLYVLGEVRGRGVGRRLIGSVLAGADERYSRVRLRAVREEVGMFYEAIGFNRTYSEPECTHAIEL